MIFIACNAFAAEVGTGATLVATALRCMSFVDPLNVDVPRPTLGWQLQSTQRSDRQTAYEIRVASSAELLTADQADAWDSGVVQSADTFGVLYAGKPLRSGQASFWKVRVWNAAGVPSAWSAVATWTTGLLTADDWKANWIQEPSDAATLRPSVRPMPLFRREFSTSKTVRRALAIVCGLGQFELSVNGRKVGDHVLDPGWTNYRKTCPYVTFDITSLLHPGNNAVGIMLGNGFYNAPATPGRYTKLDAFFGQPTVIAQINITYLDGSTETIGTDPSWTSTPGPIITSAVYGGEDYDARRLPHGWNKPGFKADSWKPSVVGPGPGGALVGASRSAPPVTVAEVFKPVKITRLNNNSCGYDFGQNCSSIPQITVTGPAGATIKLIPGELLNKDGTVSQRSSGGPAWYSYTLDDAPRQTWSPRFTYYGSRYLQIEGAVPAGEANTNGLPVIEQAASQFVTSSSRPVGEFSCSTDLFNRTNSLIRAAMRSNLQSILTDCPHREKLGWLEQTHLVGPSLMYNFDIEAVFNKVCGDVADAQTTDGLIPSVAPEFARFDGAFRDSPEWGSACILIPWQMYGFYGDAAVLKTNYGMMGRYVAYLSTRAKNDILSYGLGDWYDLGPEPPGESQLTPKALTATAFYYRDIDLLSRIAALLHHDTDAAKYTSLAAQVRVAFNRKFYKSAQHGYATNSQTANAIPLVFGLALSEDRSAILDSLVADIRKRDNGLTAGDIGYRYVLRALSDGGRSDVIYDMNSGSDRPGYGYILSTGATTLTEGWDGSASQNHFMLGHIMEWFYSDLAGIKAAPDAVAFDQLIIHPTPVGDVTWAASRYKSIRGEIACHWSINGAIFTLDVTIPPGTAATVCLPDTMLAGALENGAPLSQAKGVSDCREQSNDVWLRIASGTFHFEAARRR